MIFVTVGTHEQPFNRLVKFIDDMKRDGFINEEVVMQTGYSTYEPKYCTWQKLYPYKDMVKFVKDARIVITHGGPSSFIMPLQEGKIPIVVPRKYEFGEHVNNHQVEFCHEVANRQNSIIDIENIEELKHYIVDYDIIVNSITIRQSSNNDEFCKEFAEIVAGYFGY